MPRFTNLKKKFLVNKNKEKEDNNNNNNNNNIIYNKENNNTVASEINKEEEIMAPTRSTASFKNRREREGHRRQGTGRISNVC